MLYRDGLSVRNQVGGQRGAKYSTHPAAVAARLALVRRGGCEGYGKQVRAR